MTESRLNFFRHQATARWTERILGFDGRVIATYHYLECGREGCGEVSTWSAEGAITKLGEAFDVSDEIEDARAHFTKDSYASATFKPGRCSTVRWDESSESWRRNYDTDDEDDDAGTVDPRLGGEGRPGGAVDDASDRGGVGDDLRSDADGSVRPDSERARQTP